MIDSFSVPPVLSEIQGNRFSRAEWLDVIERLVGDHGNKLLQRKAVYEEAARLKYPDSKGQLRPNPWLHCAGWAVGDIGGGILYLDRLRPYYKPSMQWLIDEKIRWLKTVNREIWILWLPGNIVMRSGVAPEKHPLFDTLTPEWKLAARIVWEEGADSYNGCAAHSYAEQTAIERMSVFGPAGPHYFGAHSYDPLGPLHRKLGALRILDWHAPLQLPGFALRGRPAQYRDWRKLRDRIEYVVGSCCTSCSNNMMRKGSAGVCCDGRPRNWDGIIDRSFADLLQEPASFRKPYTDPPRLRAYRHAVAEGRLEGRFESPLVASFLHDLPWFAPGLNEVEKKVIAKERRKGLGIPIDMRFPMLVARDFLPDGLWYRAVRELGARAFKSN